MIVGPFGFLTIDVTEVILSWWSVMQRLGLRILCSQYRLQVSSIIIIAVKLAESKPVE